MNTIRVKFALRNWDNEVFWLDMPKPVERGDVFGYSIIIKADEVDDDWYVSLNVFREIEKMNCFFRCDTAIWNRDARGIYQTVFLIAFE